MPDSTDPINPDHYKLPNGTECIDIIEALDLPHHLASAFAYIWRAGRKGDRLEDLKKARWYLDRYIEGQEQSSNVEWKSLVKPYDYPHLVPKIPSIQQSHEQYTPSPHDPHEFPGYRTGPRPDEVDQLVSEVEATQPLIDPIDNKTLGEVGPEDPRK